jgi:hypothetical protein
MTFDNNKIFVSWHWKGDLINKLNCLESMKLLLLFQAKQKLNNDHRLVHLVATYAMVSTVLSFQYALLVVHCVTPIANVIVTSRPC